MKPSTHASRRRRLAALTAATGLFALLPVVGATTTTAGAAPTEDCVEPFPVADVAPDQLVEGLTVSRGTEPDEFDGTVLGVLDNGIAPGIDMVIADLDSPAIDAAGGIWQGMSGSPVYASDGRLIGAVAYGLSYGPSPIAGITPFEAMDDYLPSAAPRVALSPRLASVVADHADVSTRAASRGLTQLQLPLGVSGVSPRLLSRASEQAAGRSWFSQGATVMGRATGAAAPTVDDLEAGGNLAASLSYGEVALAGVGTVTSVCNGGVVGFGHPLDFAGDGQTYGLHPADAVYVQPDSLGAPFKVANLGDPVGTITDDHLTGITGTFADVPDVVTVTSDIVYGSRHRLGTSYVSVPEALAEVTFYQNLGNHFTIVDEEAGGSETQTWTIEGFDSDGSPFAFSYSNIYASEDDLLFAGAFQLPDLLYEMTQIDGVRITSVLNQIVVSPNPRFLDVGSIQQLRSGRLYTVTSRKPALVQAGKILRLRANVLGAATPRVRTFAFPIPLRARGWRGEFAVIGGSSNEEEEEDFRTASGTARVVAAQSQLDRLFAAQRRQPRADQVSSALYLEGENGFLARQQTSTPLGFPVSGIKFGSIVVR